MQEGTRGDKEALNDDNQKETLSQESVETSMTPIMVQESEAVEEAQEEIESEVTAYIAEHQSNPNNFPTAVLHNSNSFMQLHQTVNALGDMEEIAKMLIRSKLCPLKTVPDVVLAIITGNQYQLNFMTSINSIFPINGKPTLSVHLQRALILRNKILFKKVLDYEPIYTFAKVDENGNLILVDGKNNGQPAKVPVVLGNFTKYDKPLEPCKPIKEFDRITKYEFKRLMKLEDGSYETLQVTSEFRMSDAAKAGLLSKDVWVNYPARMCDARAFAIGSREIASDITLGIMSLSELADVHNVKYEVTGNFEESPILQR